VPALRITTPGKGEANLLVLLLEELLAPYVANPLLAQVLDATGAVIAVRGGTSKATLRFGAGEVKLENGLAADSWLRVDGDVDALLSLATGTDPVRPLLAGRVVVRPGIGAVFALPRRLLRGNGDAP